MISLTQNKVRKREEMKTGGKLSINNNTLVFYIIYFYDLILERGKEKESKSSSLVFYDRRKVNESCALLETVVYVAKWARDDAEQVSKSDRRSHSIDVGRVVERHGAT